MTSTSKKESNVDDYKRLSSLISGAGALSELLIPNIDMQLLGYQADMKNLMADSIETQAIQNANILKQQFARNVGGFLAGATRRGISTSSGSVQENIELSARDLGDDIQGMKSAAKQKSKALKLEAKMEKSLLKAQQTKSNVGNMFDFIKSGVDLL